MKYIDKILLSGKTVFTYEDFRIVLGIENRESIKSMIYRLKKSNIISNIQKGIYILNKYDRFEFASKLKKNSYISFETVLQKEGVIFQDYSNTIFSASNNTIEKKEGDCIYSYYKIKDSILYNPMGIINKGNYQIACLERAICDRIYLTKNYYFDNLENVDKEKLSEIASIYNKRVILEINKLIKNVK